MQVSRPMGYSLSELLSQPIPNGHETLLVMLVPSQAVSVGQGRYVPERIDAIYRDPQRTYDVLCRIETPVGSDKSRVQEVRFYARGDSELGGDLRIPLDAITKEATRAYSIGKGPDLPPGSPHPDGMRVAYEPGWTGERDKRTYHRIDDRHLALVAWKVGQAARDGASTREAVAETWSIAETTAAEWIGRARRAGMLPDVGGKRNPSVEDNQPTDRARQTLGGPRKDEP